MSLSGVMLGACTSDLAFCSDAGVATNQRQKQEWALAEFSGGGAPQQCMTRPTAIESTHTHMIVVWV
eukprot:1041754-Prymnesium_polylepis.1